MAQLAAQINKEVDRDPEMYLQQNYYTEGNVRQFICNNPNMFPRNSAASNYGPPRTGFQGPER